jgi:hypothetical protein
MGRSAKSTASVRNVSARMNVGNLNRSAKNQQQDTAKCQGKPRAVKHAICSKRRTHLYEYNVLTNILDVGTSGC